MLRKTSNNSDFMVWYFYVARTTYTCRRLGQEPWHGRVFKTGRLTVDASSPHKVPQTGEVFLPFIIKQEIDITSMNFR